MQIMMMVASYRVTWYNNSFAASILSMLRDSKDIHKQEDLSVSRERMENSFEMSKT